MEYKKLTKLDQDLSNAYNRFVSLNEEYNELLMNIHSVNKDNTQPVISKEEKKIAKKFNILRVLYWIVYIVDFIAKSFFGLPSSIFLGIIVGDIFAFQIFSLIFAFQRVKSKEKNVISQQNNNANKDELYAQLCEARRVYHSLRKERDGAYNISDNQDYQDYLECVDKIIEVEENNKETRNRQENVKVLSLEGNDGGNLYV